MNCLLVVSHPLEDSLCRHLQKTVVAELSQMGHHVRIEDLYAQNFNPVLSRNERLSYYSGNYDASEVDKQIERLKQAEALVLLFPTWWFGFPAILKGWFDRVWAPGAAYEHADDYGPIKPRLDKLRSVLVITTLGAPWWVDRLVMRQPLKRVIRFALLGACAKNARLQYLSLHNSEKLNDQHIEKFKIKILKALQTWI